MLMSIIPLARTPSDTKGATAMRNYSKKLERTISGLAPWNKGPRSLANLRGKVKPGQTVVILEGDEAQDSPLYKNAKVTRE